MLSKGGGGGGGGGAAGASVVHDHDHAIAAAARAHHHNKQVGTFSIVREGWAVEPLLFARWLRKVASARKEEAGTLYRAKGVLAQLGSTSRLVFHAVADVMEKEEAGPWPPASTPGIKLVFIGKRLNRTWLTATFEECLRPIAPPLRAAPSSSQPPSHQLDAMSLGGGGGGLLLSLLDASVDLLHRLLCSLCSAELVRVARSCTRLYDALLSDRGSEGLRQAARAHVRTAEPPHAHGAQIPGPCVRARAVRHRDGWPS